MAEEKSQYDKIRDELYSAITAQNVKRFEQILRRVVRGDANVSEILNAPDQKGDTVLHDVAGEGGEKRLELFGLCFEYGANPLIRNDANQTPFEHYFQEIRVLDKEVVELLLNWMPTYELPDSIPIEAIVGMLPEFFSPVEAFQYPTYEELLNIQQRNYADYDYVQGACEKMEELEVGGRETVKELFDKSASKKIEQMEREEKVMTAIRKFCTALKEDKPKKASDEVSATITLFCNMINEHSQGTILREQIRVLRKLLVNTDYGLGERPLDFVNGKIGAETDSEKKKAWEKLRDFTMILYGAKTAQEIRELQKDALQTNGIKPPQGKAINGGGNIGKTGNKTPV